MVHMVRDTAVLSFEIDSLNTLKMLTYVPLKGKPFLYLTVSRNGFGYRYQLEVFSWNIKTKKTTIIAGN